MSEIDKAGRGPCSMCGGVGGCQKTPPAKQISFGLASLGRELTAVMLKHQIKSLLKRARCYWHNRQLVKKKDVRSTEDYVDVGRVHDGKIILLAIDALTWRVMDPLLAQGRLPCLRSLIAGGSYGPLKTLCPALSPELWNSIGTGKLPKKQLRLLIRL